MAQQSSVKNETLADILREIPTRFKLLRGPNWMVIRVLLRGSWTKLYRFDSAEATALIQLACQEEIEARGWSWFMDCEKGDPHWAAIEIAGSLPEATATADTSALAIATALRDATESTRD